MSEPRARGAPRSPWVAFGVVAIAAFLLLTDVSIVNVAIPVIRRDLDASYGEVQLVLATYQLAFAALLITGGRLGDLYGRRRLFVLGMSGFAAASLLCALSTTPGLLIASRSLQGLCAGLLLPQVLAILHTRFGEDTRGRAFGAYGAVIGLAVVCGPLLGGALTELDLFGLSWRPIFLVNLLVGALGVFGALFFLQESRARRRARLDVIGVLLFTPVIAFVVWPLSTAREQGWPWWSIALLMSALPLLYVFVGYERAKTRRGDAPLVNMALFERRAFSVGLLVALLFFFGVPVFFLCFVVFLQAGLGFSPLAAGVALVPFAVGEALAALASARVKDELGRGVLTLGALLVAAGLAALAATISLTGIAFTALLAAPALFVAGLGVGTTVPPLLDVILAGIDGQDAGSAAGVLSTMQRVGGAVGVAAIGAVFFGRLPEGALEIAEGSRAVLDVATRAAFIDTTTFFVGLESALYLVVAALTLALPRTRVRTFTARSS